MMTDILLASFRLASVAVQVPSLQQFEPKKEQVQQLCGSYMQLYHLFTVSYEYVWTCFFAQFKTSEVEDSRSFGGQT